MDDNTTYRLSYWEGPSAPAEPFHPEDNLVVGGGEISDDTTHRVPQFFLPHLRRDNSMIVYLITELKMIIHVPLNHK